MTYATDHELEKSAIIKRVTNHFQSSINVKSAALSALKQPITQASQAIFRSLQAGHTLYACGNGGSAADSQHFVAELVNRFEIERAPLAAVSLTTDTSVLTAISNDYEYNLIFAKQVQALGRAGDVLFAISTSGNSASVIEAVKSAQAKDMIVVALTGNDGGEMAHQLRPQDREIRVPSNSTARIQETHILAIHCICDAIDWLYQKYQGGC
jgi:phosphoheptose isomerase